MQCSKNKKEVQLKGCGQDNVKQNYFNRKIFSLRECNVMPKLIPGKINNVHTRCIVAIVKTSGFTRAVCKNWGFYYI